MSACVWVLTRYVDGEAYGLASFGVGRLRHVDALRGGALPAGGWTPLWSGVGPHCGQGLVGPEPGGRC